MDIIQITSRKQCIYDIQFELSLCSFLILIFLSLEHALTGTSFSLFSTFLEKILKSFVAKSMKQA